MYNLYGFINTTYMSKVEKSKKNSALYSSNISEKSFLITLILAVFLGILGIHRFYVGKTATGVAQLITFGGCGIWALIDFIMILLNQFTDAQGYIITNND
jgi:TM2 domain-containing membrane protein YozV